MQSLGALTPPAQGESSLRGESHDPACVSRDGESLPCHHFGARRGTFDGHPARFEKLRGAGPDSAVGQTAGRNVVDRVGIAATQGGRAGIGGGDRLRLVSAAESSRGLAHSGGVSPLRFLSRARCAHLHPRFPRGRYTICTMDAVVLPRSHHSPLMSAGAGRRTRRRRPDMTPLLSSIPRIATPTPTRGHAPSHSPPDTRYVPANK